VVRTAFLLVISGTELQSQVCDPEKVVQHWQSRLHLDHWIIQVSLACELDIGAENLGDIEYHDKKGTALIRILNPSTATAPFVGI
jgi:hypothetical protein